MARRLLRRVSGSVVVVLTLVLTATPAGAGFTAIEEHDLPVTSTGSEVLVELVLRRGDGFEPRVRRPGGSSSVSECAYRLVEIPLAADAYAVLGEPPVEGARPFWLMCGSAPVRPLWVSPGDVVDVDQVVRGEAQRYVETVLGPGLSMGVAPVEFAVTGVPASFWVEGWDGTDIAVAPIDPFGQRIDIVLRLGSVTWDFGDDTAAISGDLGRAHPAVSSVRHNFVHRSTSRTDPDGAYTATATVEITIGYRLDGGPEIAVTPPLSTTTATAVIVRHAQAVLD